MEKELTEYTLDYLKRLVAEGSMIMKVSDRGAGRIVNVLEGLGYLKRVKSHGGTVHVPTMEGRRFVASLPK